MNIRVELADGSSESFADVWPGYGHVGIYGTAQVHSFVVADDGSLRIYKASQGTRKDNAEEKWEPVDNTPGAGRIVGVFPAGHWVRVREA